MGYSADQFISEIKTEFPKASVATEDLGESHWIDIRIGSHFFALEDRGKEVGFSQVRRGTLDFSGHDHTFRDLYTARSAILQIIRKTCVS